LEKVTVFIPHLKIRNDGAHLSDYTVSQHGIYHGEPGAGEPPVLQLKVRTKMETYR